MSPFFGMFLFGMGLTEIAVVVLYYFAKTKRDRLRYVFLLAMILLFDASCMHFPMTESEREYGKSLE